MGMQLDIQLDLLCEAPQMVIRLEIRLGILRETQLENWRESW